MERVLITPEAPGLGELLGDLIRANLEREPERVKLLEGAAGRVNLHVTDAEVDVGLMFTGEGLSIGSPLEDPDLSLTTDAETVMSLTRVPLRLGMPDQLTPEGRAVAAKMMNGQLKVNGLPKNLSLMIRMQRLFTVSS